MLGFGSRPAVVRERAGKVRTFVALISSNLYSKTADEFAAFYKSTTTVERRGAEIFFGFKFSPSSWYDVQAKYSETREPWMADLLGSAPDDVLQPSLSIFGGGDD
jgi:hypothetical protein